MASWSASKLPVVLHCYYNGGIIWSIFLLWKVIKTSVWQKFSNVEPLRSQELDIGLMGLILDYSIDVHGTR